MRRHFYGFLPVALLVAALALAAPALASAPQQFSITSPTGFPAGGHPSYTTGITLDTTQGAPGKVSISLAPGALASVNANPNCVKGAPQHTPACQIGTGTASALVPIPLKAYLVKPPSSGDLVGIDLVTNVPGGPVTHAGGRLVQTPAGNVATVLHLDLSSLGSTASLLTAMSLTVNGTLKGKPFTRMPTNCSPGSSTVTIAYASTTETSTASPDFQPTGCSALPYHPTLTGTAVEDLHDTGAAVSTTVTQGADEAASAATSLLLPWPTLAPNLNSLSLQGKSIPVGTATSATPLLPTPLQGQVYFTGTPVAPTLTLKFPPPATLTLIGTVNLAAHSVTFGTIPDVPVTNLTVTLFGGPKSLLNGACNQPTGTLGGSFTGQNGTASTASQPLTLTGCPGAKPVVLKLSHVSFSPRGFKIASGTKLKLTLSQAATVTVLIKRTLHGHRVKHKCRVHAKHGPRCSVRIRQSIRFQANAGASALTFRPSKLPKGNYTAQVSAAAGGRHSNKVRAKFTVK